MSEITLTDQNFAEEALKSDIPVLVDFWASWCGPCKMIAPIVKEIAEEYSGRLKVGKVNVDEQTALASYFGIQSIPTLIVFKNGAPAHTIVGYRPKEDLTELLDTLC